MIEVQEVTNTPTENDLRQIFTDVFGEARKLQELFKEVYEDYVFKHGIVCEQVGLDISPKSIVLRMGDYFLFHETKEWISRLKGE